MKLAISKAYAGNIDRDHMMLIMMMMMALHDAGLGQKITDNFGEAKLLDDIIDHWDAGKPPL